MKRNKFLVILAVVGLIGFMTLGVTNARDSQDKLKLQDVQLNERGAALRQLELKYDNLNLKLEKADQSNEDEIKKLEQEKQELDKERQRLENELQAKLNRQEAARVAAAERQKALLNGITGTSTASAAGSGCEWLRSELGKYLAPGDINAAINIASRESGCNPQASNPSSGACNVFQEYPCGKWGGTGNLAGHIRGADGYAKASYGGWNGAWAAWQAKHWW